MRNLQPYLNPLAEHLLDWFHVSMKLTVMGQMNKGMQKIEKCEPRPQIPRGVPSQSEDAERTSQETNNQSSTDQSVVHDSVTLRYCAHETVRMQIGTRAGSLACEQHLWRERWRTLPACW